MDEKEIIEIDSINGPIMCFKDDLISDHIKDFGNHTRTEFAFATAIIQPSFKIFDLGAHVGTFTLTAAQKLNHSGKILSVEGNEAHKKLLDHNLFLRNDPRLISHQAFIGPKDLFNYKSNYSNTGSGRLIKSTKGTFSGIGIDSLVKDYFNPDYIKLDIEGMEEIAIRDSDYIFNQKPIIYVETNNKLLIENNCSSDSLISHLISIGYRCFKNIGDRNAKHEFFKVSEIGLLKDASNYGDILCVSGESEFLNGIAKSC